MAKKRKNSNRVKKGSSEVKPVEVKLKNPNSGLKKNSAERDVFAGSVIGDKRQGKSTYLAEIAKAYIRYYCDELNLKYKVLIFDPSESKAFKQFPKTSLFEIKHGARINPDTGEPVIWEEGIRVIQPRHIPKNKKGDHDYELLFRSILDSKHMKNSLVITDESRIIFKETGTVPAYQSELITKHTNKGIDLLFVFHNFMDIHIRWRPHLWVYTIFKTPEEPTSPNWFASRQFPQPTILYNAWKQAYQLAERPDMRIQGYAQYQKSYKR